MCGITGIYSKDNIPNIEERIQKMNFSIKHRGPDAGGNYIENNIGLGHRRLSIIDTREVSNQPMHSNSNIWHLVFNGEIYNFEEIKLQLNYNFKTKSDTEVIIAAYSIWGIEWFIGQANGMFAIALYNSETKDLFLVYQSLGIKPLYFYNDGDNFIFSSEIKAILSQQSNKSKIVQLDEYLANRRKAVPSTGVQKHLSSIINAHESKDLSSIENKYWDIPDAFNASTEYNEEEILKGMYKVKESNKI